MVAHVFRRSCALAFGAPEAAARTQLAHRHITERLSSLARAQPHANDVPSSHYFVISATSPGGPDLPGVEDEDMQHHWDYLYEPDAKELLDGLLLRYIESQVFQAVVENNACEQAARMVAMKSATDNAGDIIDELELVYNKARQAAITQELSEIAGGAAAV